MATPADFAKWVRPFVGECPEPVLLDAIFQAALDYIKRTHLITENIVLTTQAGVASYSLPVSDANLVPNVILKVMFQGYTLDPSSQRSIEAKNYNNAGFPTEYYLDEDMNFFLYPTPQVVQNYNIKLSLVPTLSSNYIPDSMLLNERHKAIVSGALAMLLVMPYPWQKPSDGMLQSQIYENYVAKEQVRRAKGGTMKRVRSQPTFF